MAGQGKLFKIFNLIGNYRNILNNRLIVTPLYIQDVGLKMKTEEKLKSLNIPKVPKKPAGPFFRFLAEQRPLLVAKHPDWKLTDITKQCAVDWKNTPTDVKEKYKVEYDKEIVIYNQENEKYRSSLTEEQSEALSAAKKEKRNSKERRKIRKIWRDTGKPKLPKGTFVLFINEKWGLPENKDKKLGEMLIKYKDEWKNLPEDKKEKYKKIHRESIEQYNEEMVEWEAKMLKAGNIDIVRKDSRFLATTTPSHLENTKEKKKVR